MLCDTDANAKGSAFHVGRRRSPGAPAQLTGSERPEPDAPLYPQAYSLGRREGAAAYSTVLPCDDASQLTLQQQAPVRPSFGSPET
jgi:hypothetical protein